MHAVLQTAKVVFFLWSGYLVVVEGMFEFWALPDARAEVWVGGVHGGAGWAGGHGEKEC